MGNKKEAIEEAKKAGLKPGASKSVVESYIFTTMRGDNGLYSERLLVRLVEIAQRELHGLEFRDGKDIGKVEIGQLGDAEITLPVRDLLAGDDNKNYAYAKAAVKGLMGRFLEYEDEGRYQATSILNDVDIDKIAGKMVIRVNRNIWRAMLDFSKGFRRYDLEVAIKLKSRYSLRLYKLVSQQKKPISLGIDDLKRMLGIEGKYKRLDDFEKNVLKPAQKELDEVAPYSFSYSFNASKSAEVNKGRRGRPVITSITFIAIKKELNRTVESLRKSISPKFLLGESLYNLLTQKFGFDYTGLVANASLLDIANKELYLEDLLQQIAPAALRADNPQGYVINSIRKCLREQAHVVVDEGVVVRVATEKKAEDAAEAPVLPKPALKDLLDKKKK